MAKPKFKLPVIMYEEPEYPGGPTNPIPYIITSKEDPMPPTLLIEEARDTGELTVGDRGKPEAVYEYVGHHFISVEAIKAKMSLAEYDDFRRKMGMMSKAEAALKGEMLFQNAELNASRVAEELKKTIDTRKETIRDAVQQQARKTKN